MSAPPSVGRVNAHTHLELTALRHLYPAETAEFREWILKLIETRPQFSSDEILRGIEESIAALHACGTVAVGDISTTGLSVEPLLESGLAGVVYYEVLGREEETALAALEEAKGKIDAWRRQERNGMRIGLTIHAPYSCHPNLFRQGAKWCIAESVPLCIHLAESPAEVSLLIGEPGAFGEYPARFDLPVPGRRPLAYLEDLGVLEARPLLIHMVQVTAAEIAATRHYGYSVVHCPRSNQALRCGLLPLEVYQQFGVNVALGTDSLASSPSLDIADEIEAAYELQGGRYPREVFERMATEGGRIALGLAQQVADGK